MGKGHVLCEGVICDFQKLPLLTDLINVKCASPGVRKQTYFETNGAVESVPKYPQYILCTFHRQAPL